MRFASTLLFLLMTVPAQGQDIDLRAEIGSVMPLAKLADPGTGPSPGLPYTYRSERQPSMMLGVTLSAWFHTRLGVTAAATRSEPDIDWFIPEQSIEYPSGSSVNWSDTWGTARATISQFSTRAAIRFPHMYRRIGAEVSAGVQVTDYSGYRSDEVDGTLIGPVVGVNLYTPVRSHLRMGLAASYASYKPNAEYARQHDVSLMAGVSLLLSRDPDN